MLPQDPSSSEFVDARNQAMLKLNGWKGHDELDPRGPSGHAYAILVSARLTSDYRRTHCKQAMDITPQDVIGCLVQAEVKNWVLMGLHGYVGYLPTPRATQDVDVMVPYSQKRKTIKAIADRWPALQERDLEQVVRFLDPTDLDTAGNAKPIIDIMLPWSPFQKKILQHWVWVDAETGFRLPTIDAAIVSKYAAFISPHRDAGKKEYDAGDLRRLIKTNHKDISMETIQDLAGDVWEGGAREIKHFIDLALNDKPFTQ